MLPSHQDLAINHATVSAPSSGSCTIGWNTPSDLTCRDSPGTPLRTRPYGKDLPALLTYWPALLTYWAVISRPFAAARVSART